MKDLLKVGGPIALSILVVWGLWGAFHAFLGGLKSPPIDKLGQWGDTFGALNALFSGLGFSAIIATLWLQQKQLMQGREEQSAQIRENHRQRFESSFFELLRLFRETRDNVRFKYSVEISQSDESKQRNIRGGQSAIRRAWDEAKWWIDSLQQPPSKEQVAFIYEQKVHSRYENSLGPYFRVLYTICYKIKNDNTLTDSEKITYARLLRSQLSGYEIALLGLNGLSRVSKNLSDYIIEFRLLKYVPEDERKVLLSLYYPVQAFSGR